MTRDYIYRLEKPILAAQISQITLFNRFSPSSIGRFEPAPPDLKICAAFPLKSFPVVELAARITI